MDVFLYLAFGCFVVFMLIMFRQVFFWILFHFVKFLVITLKDIYYFFVYKEYNKWSGQGHTICYFGLFGCGKSLNLAKYINDTLSKYNGRYYIDRETKQKVKQVFVVHSNFKLNGVPTVPITSINDITDTIDSFGTVDGVRTCHLFAIDEINNILNCKDYKNNSNPYVLRGIMQVRKSNIQLCLSGQLPAQIDKSFRDIVEEWRFCHKLWRIAWFVKYSGDSVRNTENIEEIKPRGRFSWFVLDKHYKAFDTFEMIKELKKGVDDHTFISAKDIQAESEIFANTYISKKGFKKLRR